MTAIYLERREPVHNRQRFYTLTVARTLFGSWTLIREWGRIGHPGTARESWFETEAAAIEAGAKIRKQEEKRGYRAIDRFNQTEAGQGRAGQGREVRDNRDSERKKFQENTRYCFEDRSDES